MSLIVCSECGNNVSEFADKCPHCGCPIDIIKQNKKEIEGCLYTIVNGKKIDVTKIVHLILTKDKNNLEIARELIIKDLNISPVKFIKPVLECNGAPVECNAEPLDQIHNRQQSIQSSKPKCPTCGSTNIQKISATSKALGAIGFGLLSKTARSQFKCNKCGYKW